MNLLEDYFGPDGWWLATFAIVLSGVALLLWVRRTPRTRTQMVLASITSIGGAVVLVYLFGLLMGVWECMHGNCL